MLGFTRQSIACTPQCYLLLSSQGLISNDAHVLEAPGAKPLYACILTPYGRVAHDIILHQERAGASCHQRTGQKSIIAQHQGWWLPAEGRGHSIDAFGPPPAPRLQAPSPRCLWRQTSVESQT